jgi:hypothetical protein
MNNFTKHQRFYLEVKQWLDRITELIDDLIDYSQQALNPERRKPALIPVRNRRNQAGRTKVKEE